jgi:dTDP-4-dehydrorhamnose reductase
MGAAWATWLKGPAVGAVMVHFSTDYVFDGKASTPYAVDHPLCPVNAYGRSKAAGELALRASGAEHLIVRTSWLYAPWGENFVRTILRLCEQRDEIAVVGDQRGRPTSATYLARRSLESLHAGARGTYHVTDGGECTWYELACAIRELSGATCHVRPCTSNEFPRPAPRPKFSVLDLGSTEALLGPSRCFRDNLREVVLVLRGD